MEFLAHTSAYEEPLILMAERAIVMPIIDNTNCADAINVDDLMRSINRSFRRAHYLYAVDIETEKIVATAAVNLNSELGHAVFFHFFVEDHLRRQQLGAALVCQLRDFTTMHGKTTMFFNILRNLYQPHDPQYVARPYNHLGRIISYDETQMLFNGKEDQFGNTPRKKITASNWNCVTDLTQVPERVLMNDRFELHMRPPVVGGWSRHESMLATEKI